MPRGGLHDTGGLSKATTHAGSSGPLTVSRDAPSTLFELVGVVHDPEASLVAPQSPATVDLRPDLLTRQSA